MLCLTWLLAAMAVLAAVAAADATSVTDTASADGVITPVQSFGITPNDFNGDGITDVLFIPQNKTPGLLYRGNADGTYTLDQYLGSNPDHHGCAAGDVDRNGLLDFYCVYGASHSGPAKANELWLQTSPDVFQNDAVAAGVTDPWGRGRNAVLFDANNDGWPDLFVTNDHPRPDGIPTPDRFFLNRGADPITGKWLGFQDSPSFGLDVEEGNRGCVYSVDFNHDGWNDLVFCGSGGVHFDQNTGGTGFVNVAATWLGSATWTAADTAMGDINHDGVPDLVYAKLTQFGVRLGLPAGGFAKATQLRKVTAGRSVALADVNGDGWPDVYLLQGNGKPGCGKSCLTNYPDVMLINTAGVLTPLPVPEATTGHGDLAVTVTPTRIWVANGADLYTGPVQVLDFAPDPVPAP